MVNCPYCNQKVELVFGCLPIHYKDPKADDVFCVENWCYGTWLNFKAAQHGVHWTENGLAQADGESTLAVVVQYRQGVK